MCVCVINYVPDLYTSKVFVFWLLSPSLCVCVCVCVINYILLTCILIRFLVFCFSLPLYLTLPFPCHQLASQRKMLKSLRRGIKGPIMRCRKCQCEVFGYIREHAKTVEHIVSITTYVHKALTSFSHLLVL